MEKIQWSEEFSVGNPHLDKRNQELIKLVNRMLECKDEDVDDEVLSAILDQLMDYSIAHFKEEESYMEYIGCRDLSSQKAHHGIFRKRIFIFYLDFLKRKSNLHRKIRDFLVDWIAFHIFYDDKRSFSLREVAV